VRACVRSVRGVLPSRCGASCGHGRGRDPVDADAAAALAACFPRVLARLNFGEVWARILVDFDRIEGCRVVFAWFFFVV